MWEHSPTARSFRVSDSDFHNNRILQLRRSGQLFGEQSVNWAGMSKNNSIDSLRDAMSLEQQHYT
jgi:hypothetical protein